MKACIAGSRMFEDEATLFGIMDWFVQTHGQIEQVISGAARGADRFGEHWAKARGIPVHLEYPKWHKHGHGAGMIRNKIMAQAADVVVVFWDGMSPGSQQMIEYSKSIGKEVYVFRV
jgi:hypothetical protein